MKGIRFSVAGNPRYSDLFGYDLVSATPWLLDRERMHKVTATVDDGGSPKRDDLQEALEIVYREYKHAESRLDAPEIKDVRKFGHLFLFTPDERDQLEALRILVRDYLAQQQHARPLSFAVFGQPGSGKSFAVKQIFAEVERESRSKNEWEPKLTLTLNLTQIPDPKALGEALARATENRLGPENGVKKTVTVLFIDEFDAACEGAPYGWLAWFLAPMEDGYFVHGGRSISLDRTILVFAGGTAATMQEFSELQTVSAFRAAKGPDFVSRLRGFLDVKGPNAEPRMLRRAVLLRAAFDRRVQRDDIASIRPHKDLLVALLKVGRYRHGARSIEAVVELSKFDKEKWESLPEDHLLGLHIDRGPLNRELIGGAVALSGYAADASGASNSNEMKKCWSAVAHRLWREGASIAYGGRWEPEEGELMLQLVKELSTLAPEPSRTRCRRENPEAWLESFIDNTEEDYLDILFPAEVRKCGGLWVTVAAHLSEEERKLEPWLARVIEFFRRRLAVSEASVARFVIAGSTTTHGGRFPGIAEEVMLMLAQRKPIYVAGAFGGAAAEVGALLGLSHPRGSGVPKSFAAQSSSSDLSAIVDKLQPGPWLSLPVDGTQLAQFLGEHALGGPKWPDNGLSFAENRKLFLLENFDELAELVVTGLKRLFQ